MIPLRITMKGFLCFKEEQVLDFNGASLWVLSGGNGRGKSAVFDAMTFALFGAHRGGKADFQKLINDESDRLTVDFEVDLGGSVYHIHRSLARGNRSVERQVFFHEPGGRGPAVPETHMDAGYKAWLADRLGLSYETFTTSVLLLQGQSEKLLSANPESRKTVLGDVADIAAYQALHKVADERRRDGAASAKEARHRLNARSFVDPASIEEADRNVIAAETNLAEARHELTTVHALESQARSWKDLTERRGVAASREAEALAILAASDSLARDADRLKELDAVVPTLAAAIEDSQSLTEAEGRSCGLEIQLAAVGRKIDLVAGLTADARDYGDQLREEIARDVDRRAEIGRRLVELAGPIQRANAAQAQTEAIRLLESEIAGYPSGLEDEVSTLNEDHSRGLSQQVALPSLERFAESRSDLKKALDRAQSEEAAASRGQADLTNLAAEREVALGLTLSARDEDVTLIQKATIAKALADDLDIRLGRFEDLRDASSCDRCGQPLTATHFEAERQRLRSDRDDATQRHHLAEEQRLDASSRRDTAESALAAVDSRIATIDKTLQANRRAGEQAQHEAEARRSDCNRAYGQLEAGFRNRIVPVAPADWLATCYPDPSDIAETNRDVADLPKVANALSEARKRLKKLDDARTRLDQSRISLDTLRLLPSDGLAVGEQAILQAEDDALAQCLKSHETQRSLNAVNTTRLGEVATSLAKRQSQHEADLSAERASASTLRASLGRFRAELPATWHAVMEEATRKDIDALTAERGSLRERDVEQLAQEIPTARQRVEAARVEIEALDADLETIPPGARMDPAGFASLRVRAEAGEKLAGDNVLVAQLEARRLKDDSEQYEELRARALAAEHNHQIADTLARLLGREGLQRHLLRDAESRIVEEANPILREISGGDLELRLLNDGDADHVLQLEVIDRTHGRTRIRDLAFLSGGQKFRVAVSLALAIGQYARGRDRPIESVIIDEGFGCLDRQGRQEMIAQIPELRGRLARIILVSHQEEFAEAFPDGYRFEARDGSTFVEAFHQ